MKAQITKKIEQVWNELNLKINQGDLVISSEKSLVFNFAWKFNKLFKDENIDIDFERDLFDKFLNGKYLDLLIKVKEKNEAIFLIGIEFKFPNKKKSSSGHTQVRQKIVNDLKRLDYLVQNKKIDFGVFLCATNENNFLVNKDRGTASDFIVHHQAKYKRGDFYPSNDKHKERIIISNDINFEWSKSSLNGHSEFSFLKPIYFQKEKQNNVLSIFEPLETKPINNSTFKIKIGKDYWKKGYLTPPKNSLPILPSEGSEIRLKPRNKKEICCKIVNNANKRILGNIELKDYIQSNYKIGDIFEFEIVNTNEMKILN